MICHKTALFGLICTNIQAQSICRFISELHRESTYRTFFSLQNNRFFWPGPTKRNIFIFILDFKKKLRWILLWSYKVNSVFCPSHCYIKKASLFRILHASVLFYNQWQNRIIFNLWWKSVRFIASIDYNYLIIAKSFWRMCCHKSNIHLRIFYRFNLWSPVNIFIHTGPGQTLTIEAKSP